LYSVNGRTEAYEGTKDVKARTKDRKAVILTGCFMRTCRLNK